MWLDHFQRAGYDGGRRRHGCGGAHAGGGLQNAEGFDVLLPLVVQDVFG